MRAVLSDIHGNLEALDAVLADAACHGAAEVYCLGDLVGYGPNPVECLERAMGWPVVLLGNHDQAALNCPAFAGTAIESANRSAWRQLSSATGESARAFLADRPHTYRDGESLFVHGTPRNPLHEYAFPEDIYNPRKLERVFALIERYCFCGNTHVPGVFTEEEPGRWAYHDTCEIGGVWQLDGRKTLVNVGSVGQPRDGDWRACYVLLDGPTVTFRRVVYDVAATVRRIRNDPDIDDISGDRLREGR